MKYIAILDEMVSLAKTHGLTVRRETGSFRGGYCILHEKQMIIINRLIPAEHAVLILAKALSGLKLELSHASTAVVKIIAQERTHSLFDGAVSAEALSVSEYVNSINETIAA